MSIRVGSHKLLSTADFEISSTSSKLQSVDYLSFSCSSEYPVGITIYSNTSDTSTYPTGKITLMEFDFVGHKILTKADFPTGDLSASIFGDDATYKKLQINRNAGGQAGASDVLLHYTVSDASVSGDYSTEEIQDIVGAMFTSNTETNITATYEDSDGTIDLVSVQASVSANTTNADFPVVFHNSSALHDDGATDFTYNPSTNNLKIGKLTANTTGSTLAGIVSVGTQDGDDRLYIARYRDETTVWPYAHIYAGLDGLSTKCGFKIVVRNNSGTLGDGLVIDGNTKNISVYGTVDGRDLAADGTKLDGIASGATNTTQYTDAAAISAVSTADDYLKNDADDTMDGSLTLNQSLFLIDSGSGATGTKTKLINRNTTANRTLDVPDASGMIQVDVGGGFPLLQGTAKITLSTADFNSLNTTPVQLVAAQGANTVIIPTGGIIRVTRAATQTNSAVNLDFHYNGISPTYGTTSLVHLRRFMWNETGDRVYTLTTPAIEMSQNLTDDVNSALEVSASSALTNNCITSATIFLTYNIINIS